MVQLAASVTINKTGHTYVIVTLYQNFLHDMIISGYFVTI